MSALFTLIVETPQSCSQKYDWNPKTQRFKLEKALPAGMSFPFEFGFIPGSKGEDGDPLDAVIISEFKTFPGCEMEARLIGAATGKQKDEGEWIRNDRFFFVPVVSQQFCEIKHIDELADKFLKEILDFLVNYNQENQFVLLKTVSRQKAAQLIKQGKKG